MPTSCHGSNLSIQDSVDSPAVRMFGQGHGTEQPGGQCFWSREAGKKVFLWLKFPEGAEHSWVWCDTSETADATGKTRSTLVKISLSSGCLGLQRRYSLIICGIWGMGNSLTCRSAFINSQLSSFCLCLNFSCLLTQTFISPLWFQIQYLHLKC